MKKTILIIIILIFEIGLFLSCNEINKDTDSQPIQTESQAKGPDSQPMEADSQAMENDSQPIQTDSQAKEAPSQPPNQASSSNKSVLIVKGRLISKKSKEPIGGAQFFVSCFVEGKGCRYMLYNPDTDGIAMFYDKTGSDGRFEVTVKRKLLVSDELCFFINNPSELQFSPATLMAWKPGMPEGIFTIELEPLIEETHIIDLNKVLGDIEVE